jgi:hypothetical protein
MERRRHRTAPRLAGPLACAAVTAMLVAGCSSGSGSGAGGANTPSATASPGTPPLDPAKYATLPASCKTVAAATVSALVPKVKAAGGTEATSSDIRSRAGCSWTGNGKDGYQYRWLSVTLQRFASSAELGSADKQARERYTDQVRELGTSPGMATVPLTGVGDQASSVGGKVTVSKVASRNATVVARSGNVVLIVEFVGAGLAGKKNPSATTVNGGALRAAKDAVAAVAAANA